MLYSNFLNNFFFTRFLIFFCFFAIFIFWSIDLNSEEVFIFFNFIFILILINNFLKLKICKYYLVLFNFNFSKLLNIFLISLLIFEINMNFFQKSIMKLKKYQKVLFNLFFIKNLNKIFWYFFNLYFRVWFLRFKIFFLLNFNIYIKSFLIFNNFNFISKHTFFT